jgi:hypothetical protein
LVSAPYFGSFVRTHGDEIDLFDNVYELVDSLTYKLRTISPSMWPVFEITYKLFKSDAVDFLEGTLDLLIAISLD